MKTQEEIANILIKNLSDIYCYNCANEGNETICDSCDRKSMMWELSRDTAEKIAYKILKEENHERNEV